MGTLVTAPHNMRDIVRGYYHAWTSGKLELARFFLSDRLDFQGSIDTFHTADTLIAKLGAFHKKLKSTRLLKEFYSGNGAMLLYDCITDSPAGTIRTAEYFGVSDGNIFEIRLVFDATLLRQSMGVGGSVTAETGIPPREGKNA